MVTVIVAALCLVLFVFPVVMIIQGAFVDGGPSRRDGWTLQALTDVYGNSGTLDAFKNSAILAVSVTLFGKALGFYFAWVVARTNTPLRRLIAPTMIAVLAMPTLFFGIGWSLLGNESSGLLNQGLQALTGSDIAPINVESFPGLVFVSILKSTAFGFLLLIGPMYAMSRAMEEAASVSGARRLRVFFGINVPVLAPAVLSVLVLGFVLGLEYFELPLLLGTPAGVDVLSTEIFNYLNDVTPPGYAQASAVALTMLVALVVLLFAQQRLLGKRNFQTVSSKTANTDPWNLRGWKWLGTAIFLLYAILALVLPLIQLVRTSLLPYLGATSGLSTRAYTAIFDSPYTAEALRNTGLLAVLGGFFVMVLALGLVYTVRRTKPAWVGRLISGSTWLPWATPGTALALGILWIVLSVPFARQVYGGLTIMLIGLVIVAMPLAMRSIDSAIDQIGDEMEEAAWVSGAGPLRAYGAVVVRLILPSFFVGWLLCGIVISGNLVMPLMLGSSTLRTIPGLTFDLYSTGRAPEAAAFATVVLALLIGIYLLGMLLHWALARWLSARLRRPVAPADVADATASASFIERESSNRVPAAAGTGPSTPDGGR